ncbi:hypothetical protein NUACC21_25690 [Scytonema sp. NUACC21]
MIPNKVPVEVVSGVSAAECLRDIVQAYSEYRIVAEEEQTKRSGIEAWEKTTIAQINAQRDALVKYLEQSFDERAKNFYFLFEKVDRAIIKCDENQLALSLNSIIEIAKNSPFKDLADLTLVRAALNDPDHEWEF